MTNAEREKLREQIDKLSRSADSLDRLKAAVLQARLHISDRDAGHFDPDEIAARIRKGEHR